MAHVEIQFPHYPWRNHCSFQGKFLILILQVFLQKSFLKCTRIKNSSNDSCENWNSLVNFYRNTISCGLKNTLKLAHGRKISPLYGLWEVRLLEGKYFFLWVMFWTRFLQPFGWKNYHTWNLAHSEIFYFCMSLYMRRPLRNFYTLFF